MADSAFVKIVSAYTALGLLIGIPVNILFNGPLCIEPALPPWYHREYGMTGCISADTRSLEQFNDALEEFAFSRKINRKRLFEIQNCIEELSIRILGAIPDAQIEIRMKYDDTISARFSYPGERYNPLRTRKEDDEMDMLSLKLVKHRALRAAYRYARSSADRVVSGSALASGS